MINLREIIESLLEFSSSFKLFSCLCMASLELILHMFLKLEMTFMGYLYHVELLLLSLSVLLLFYLGFGLVLGYMKHLSFSGLGFTLLITAMTFQWYFIVNAFWSKSRIQPSLQSFSATDDFPLRLS